MTHAGTQVKTDLIRSAFFPNSESPANVHGVTCVTSLQDMGHVAMFSPPKSDVLGLDWPPSAGELFILTEEHSLLTYLFSLIENVV